eukprot:c16105_g1_i3 orf=353-1966(-)
MPCSRLKRLMAMLYCIRASVSVLFFVSFAVELAANSSVDVDRTGLSESLSVLDAGESSLGDPGMKDPRVRVALEAWDFCNKVGKEGNGLPSPRQADCADMRCFSRTGPCTAVHHVTERDNLLKTGDAFPQGSFHDYENPDQYAVEKELYLASLCEIKESQSEAWHFWMIMLKNGNFDLASHTCPSTFSRPVKKAAPNSSFPCFGPGCMNQPRVYHKWSVPERPCGRSSGNSCDPKGLVGSFYGTYDLEASLETGNSNISYFSVSWEKNANTGSWMFHHTLKVTKKYPWLMLYLRADATKGVSGGYPYETRGMMMKVPESPNFKVIVSLNVTKGGGPQSQFYLIDIGGCWKNNGQRCDGNTATDVTRYSEMIINPETKGLCKASDLSQCPPYHISTHGRKIFRNDSANFPYSAYHLYCAPANAEFAEHPFHFCDPYSNPQPQELMQLLPHPEWAVHGYPASRGEGWKAGKEQRKGSGASEKHARRERSNGENQDPRRESNILWLYRIRAVRLREGYGRLWMWALRSTSVEKTKLLNGL